MVKLRDHALMNIPRCLSELRATSVTLIEDRGADAVAFRLSHPSFGEVGAIHGFDLCQYNCNYKGPPVFISPLAIKWQSGHSTVIFDSNLHGYHGEMHASAKLRGAGEAASFTCSQCGGKAFKIVVQFDYWDACNDLREDEPDLKIEDYFCNFIAIGECVACRHLSRVLDMDL
jgi:hypothetical protein